MADAATAYFRALVARQNRQDQLAGAAAPRASRGTVVFDIDETALSNLDTFFSRAAPWSRLLGMGPAADDCVHPHLEYMPFAGAPASPPLVLMAGKGAAGEGAPGAAAGEGGAAAGGPRLCASPPLKAMLDLYEFLAASNFTLVGALCKESVRDTTLYTRCDATASLCVFVCGLHRGLHGNT